MPSPLIYSPKYNTDLSLYGVDKPFALDRGEQVLAKLKEDALAAAVPAPSYNLPQPIYDEYVRLVHTPEYLESLAQTQTWLEIFEFSEQEYQPEKAQIALPELIHDLRLKCGGTLAAADLALTSGLAANLGGGYHHAFPDRGRGFCVLHDIAIAIKSLQTKGKIRTAMTVDLDFHQGDGTALIFAGNESVFTFSVHSQEGWPDEKQVSDLDLPIRESDSHLYMEYVEKGLKESLRRMTPDLVIYVAGSDPYEKDVLPGTKFLRLPLETMKERDFYVIDTFAHLGIPLAMVFAGGYGPHVWEVHYWAVRRLLEKASGAHLS